MRSGIPKLTNKRVFAFSPLFTKLTSRSKSNHPSQGLHTVAVLCYQQFRCDRATVLFFLLEQPADLFARASKYHQLLRIEILVTFAIENTAACQRVPSLV